MNQEILMTRDEARRMTEEVKQDAAALWTKLLQLYECGAHIALGYSSWATYCADEFEMGKATAYRMLGAAKVVETLDAASLHVETPVTEGVARELVPLLDEPEEMAEAWKEANAERPASVETTREAARKRLTPNGKKEPTRAEIRAQIEAAAGTTPTPPSDPEQDRIDGMPPVWLHDPTAAITALSPLTSDETVALIKTEAARLRARAIRMENAVENMRAAQVEEGQGSLL